MTISASAENLICCKTSWFYVFDALFILIVVFQMVPAVQNFIVNKMGQAYIEPPTFDLARSYMDSSHSTPLIFVLSPGADPMNVLMKFAVEKGA